MATTVIGNECFSGALGGLMSMRYVGSFDPADYADEVSAAAAITAEFLAQNTLLNTPLSDTSNANAGIGPVVCEMARSAIINSGATSVKAADYVNYAKQIVAASYAALAGLT